MRSDRVAEGIRVRKKPGYSLGVNARRNDGQGLITTPAFKDGTITCCWVLWDSGKSTKEYIGRIEEW